jgi:hypothetical protein
VYKKIVGILILSLFIGSSFVPIIIGYNYDIENISYENTVNISFLPPDDQLDQFQSDRNTAYTIGSNTERMGAQSFKPTLNMLTRVQIIIIKRENVSGGYVVSIRSSLDGIDLTSISVDPSIIPEPPVYSWIEFDFPDISVLPESTYYIVSKSENKIDHYQWAASNGNPYYRGSMFYLWEGSSFVWEEITDLDFMFKTYGYIQEPPNKPSKPTGVTSGKIGNSHSFTSSTTDPENDYVFYRFDWGDETNSGWDGPHYSGDNVTLAHSWAKQGTYPIKVKAKDIYDSESVWSDSLVISMSKIKSSNPLLQQLTKIFERFPFIERLLNQIIFIN